MQPSIMRMHYESMLSSVRRGQHPQSSSHAFQSMEKIKNTTTVVTQIHKQSTLIQLLLTELASLVVHQFRSP